MKSNAFDLKEIQATAINYAKENPLAALIALVIASGLAKGVSDGIAKLKPTLEEGFNKVVKCLPKSTAHPTLANDSIVDTTVEPQQVETFAA